MSICNDNFNDVLLSSRMEFKDQSEFGADLHSRPVFFDLPPVLPGFLLSSGQLFPPSQYVSTRFSTERVEPVRNFTHSANSLRIQHAPDPDYCEVLVSSAECRVDKKRTHDMIGLRSPVSVDIFDRLQSKLDSPADEIPAHNAEGAVKRCEASVKRLERMNGMLDSIADGAWLSSDQMQALTKKLNLNKFYAAIRSRMFDSRLMHQVQHASQDSQESQPKQDGIDPAAADPDLYKIANKCGAEMSDEVSTLQLLEDKTLEKVRAMLASINGEIPICTEEVETILSHVKVKFNPARKALSAAMRILAVEKDLHSLIARYVECPTASFTSRIRIDQIGHNSTGGRRATSAPKRCPFSRIGSSSISTTHVRPLCVPAPASPHAPSARPSAPTLTPLSSDRPDGDRKGGPGPHDRRVPHPHQQLVLQRPRPHLAPRRRVPAPLKPRPLWQTPPSGPRRAAPSCWQVARTQTAGRAQTADRLRQRSE